MSHLSRHILIAHKTAIQSISVKMAHSARIRNLFDLLVPLNGPANLEAVPLLGTNFGFALGLKNNDENCLQYHIQLAFKHPRTGEDVALTNCFEWAKRNAIRFQRSEATQEVEGIIVKIKLPPKVFDFRKHRTQQTRIQVNEIKNGQIIKQAFSNIVQILPKNRQGATTQRVSIWIKLRILPASVRQKIRKYVFSRGFTHRFIVKLLSPCFGYQISFRHHL